MSQTMRDGGALGEVPRALGALLAAEMRMGRELLEAVGLPVPDLRRALRRRPGCCDVPPPCWMPRPLGECVSAAAACERACVRLRLTNCDRARRQVRVGVMRAPEGWKVSVAPAAPVLGPFERVTVEVCLEVPQGTAEGETHEMLVWVRGCREHYLRWTVRVAPCGRATSCHEVAVDDCPDHRHHWYDHFYCERGCLPPLDGGLGPVTHA
jgi:hypothetical protein